MKTFWKPKEFFILLGKKKKQKPQTNNNPRVDMGNQQNPVPISYCLQ